MATEEINALREELRRHMDETRENHRAVLVWQARVEEKLKREEEFMDTIIELVRGDGNGDHGLVNKLAALRHEIAMLSRRIESIEKAQKESARPSVSAIAERGRWKLYTAVIVGITSVLTAGLTALVAALMK